MSLVLILIIGSLETQSMRLVLHPLNGALPLLPVSSEVCARNQRYSDYSGADPDSLNDISLLAICISFGIFATTIHTQDFKDVEGDKRNKRRTLPILYPIASRYSVVICILTWTLMLSRVWNLELQFGLVFLSAGVVVSFRFLTLHTCADDQVSFYWYNVRIKALSLSCRLSSTTA